jgi:hypothetical protein
VDSEAAPTTRVSVRSAGLIASLSLVWGFVWFTVSGHDDCHITYWASYSLAEFGEIVNYSGARVEQSSSLLHTLSLALLAKLTPWTIPTLGFFLGVACSWLAVFRMARFAGELGLKVSLTGIAATAASGPWLYWAMGGLETSLVALLLLEFVISSVRIHRGQQSCHGAGTVLLLLAIVWVRPEGYFVVAAGLIGISLARYPLGGQSSARPWLTMLAIATACFALTSAWRHSYFGGALFPQPVEVKFDGAVGGRELSEGFGYLLDALKRPDIGLAALVALGGAVVSWRRGERPDLEAAILILLPGAYLGFVVSVGGDWMEASRFVAHVWPLLGLLFLFGLSSFENPRFALAASSVTLVAAALSVALIAGRESAGTTLPKLMQVDPLLVEESGEEFSWTERARLGNARDVLFFAELDQVVTAAVSDEQRTAPVKILSGQAGMLMYHLAVKHHGEFEFIDRFALSSKHLIPLVAPCKLPGGHYGLRLKSETFFRCIKKLGREDLFPDIIFDIRVHHMKSAKKRGMKVLHRQSGNIVSWMEPGQANLIFRKKVPAFEFVAVRKELYPRLRLAVAQKEFAWDKRRLEALDPASGS